MEVMVLASLLAVLCACVSCLGADVERPTKSRRQKNVGEKRAEGAGGLTLSRRRDASLPVQRGQSSPNQRAFL